MHEPCFRRQLGNSTVHFLAAQRVNEIAREHNTLAVPLRHTASGEMIDPPVHRFAEFGAERLPLSAGSFARSWRSIQVAPGAEI